MALSRHSLFPLTVASWARDIDGGRGELVEAALVLLVRYTRVRAGVLRHALADVMVATLRLLGGDLDTDVPGAGADFSANLRKKADSLAKIGLASLGQDGNHGGDGAQGVEVHFDGWSVGRGECWVL